VETGLRAALAEFRAFAWPENFAPLCGHLKDGAENALLAFTGLAEALESPDGMMPAYRALRHTPRALEALYPLSGYLTPVNQFFVAEESRGDEALLAALAGADRERQDIGVIHASNEKFERGGFSLYIPETYDAARPHPLIVALHGGAGHGRAFLWTWLRQARSRGAIVLSPTAKGGTWSLMEPELDAANIARMLDHVREHWNIDNDRLLLTGMSDGGTYCYLCGLMGDARFTHLAPVSASFQAMLLQFIDGARLRGLPVYLTHGVRDWMFPIEIAREAHQALSAAGAKVTYREIEDLSHTYPSEENARILDWFMDEA
jgi:phospholipase/carboxylesterase